MSLTDIDKQRYAADLEQLQDEQRRRIAEKVESGELRREVLPPAVVSSEEDAAKVIAARELRTAAALRESIYLEAQRFQSGDGDNSEPIACIITGVPRRREPDKWRPSNDTTAPPQYHTAKDREWEARLADARARQDEGPWEPPPPIEWHRFVTNVRNPKGNDPGQIIEAEWSVQNNGTLCVRDLDHRPYGTFQLHPGDSTLAAARKIVREKRPGAFFDPLPPSTRRTV